MSCLGPLKAYWSKDVNVTGKRSLVFDPKKSLTGIPFDLSCGKCIQCKLRHSLNWAVRCMHENMMHEVSSFVTLTYSDKYLPDNGSLDYRDFQLFMKRLRFASEFKFKFYMCGEYGDGTNRPHYHALLFGCDFSDRVFYRNTKSGSRIDKSEYLDKLWSKGLCSVGDVTFESAAYVARYVTKKVTGPLASDHYMGSVPEFSHMSNGIGKAWLDKFGAQTFALDNVVVSGKTVPLPRYYDVMWEKSDPVKFERAKQLRRAKARAKPADLKNRRSWVREKVTLSRLSLNRRDVDET